MEIHPNRCLVVVCVTMMQIGCGGTTFVNTAELPDSYQCEYMKNICKDAREFEGTYAKMSPEDKADAEHVLKAYRLQCNDALELCRKSAPGKK